MLQFSGKLTLMWMFFDQKNPLKHGFKQNKHAAMPKGLSISIRRRARPMQLNQIWILDHFDPGWKPKVAFPELHLSSFCGQAVHIILPGDQCYLSVTVLHACAWSASMLRDSFVSFGTVLIIKNEAFPSVILQMANDIHFNLQGFTNRQQNDQ